MESMSSNFCHILRAHIYNDLYAAFAEDAQKNLAGNKAAGLRARKASLEIEKLCKEFRKASLAK